MAMLLLRLDRERKPEHGRRSSYSRMTMDVLCTSLELILQASGFPVAVLGFLGVAEFLSGVSELKIIFITMLNIICFFHSHSLTSIQ